MSAIWLKYLPAFLRKRLAHRQVLQAVVGNTGWLFLERALRMVVGVAIGVWVARHLGPDQFGLLSYAAALTVLFSPLASVGVDRVLLRDLVQNRNGRYESLGTAFFLKLIASAVACGLAGLTATILRPSSDVVPAMTVIISLALVFQSFDAIKVWFESLVRSKYVAIGQCVAVAVSALVKVLLIIYDASLVAFAWAILLESAIGALGLLLTYRRTGEVLQKWRLTRTRTRRLLGDSWPFLVAALATGGIQMKVGQLMIGHMLDDKALGIYVAATRLSETWFFLPAIVASSVTAVITRAKMEDEKLYYRWIESSLRALALSAIGIATLTSLTAPFLIDLLFGPDYADAAPVLRVHIWTTVFAFLGIGVTPWILNEGCMRLAMWRSITAMVTDVTLNLILIPKWGVVGAAVSALAGWAVGFFLLNLVLPGTRRIFWIQLRACLPLFRDPGSGRA